MSESINIKKRFIDLDMNFKRHPATDDVVRVYGTAAIKQAIKNLLLTQFYERPFHPEIGSQIRASLFELMSDATAASIRSNILSVLKTYEPRVRVTDLFVRTDFENNLYSVDLTFVVKNSVDPIQLDFILRQAR